MGDDWRGRFDDLESLCEVVYLPRTEGISTTDLKRSIRTISDMKLSELKRALASLQGIVEGLDG